MSDLAKRVAVAAVGIPTVLALVYRGGWFLSVPLALFAAWASHELARMARESDVRPVEWVAAPAAAGMVLLASALGSFVAFAPWAVGTLGVVGAVAIVVALRTHGEEGAPLASAAVTLFGVLYVGLALSFAPLLHALPGEVGWPVETGATRYSGLASVALPLAVTWVGDASAYFAGSAWGAGRAKLAPSISPNKSWVGFWAAVIGGGLASVLWLAVVRWGLGPSVPGGTLGAGVYGFGGHLIIAVVGCVIAVTAVVGDLVESLLKREAGVKDSGTFFPGHGGVLDRIDSLLFTIPTAYVALLVLGGAS